MSLVIGKFRAIANASAKFQFLFLVFFVGVFVFHHMMSRPLQEYPDGMNLPDARFGYTPAELNAWYDSIGTEGCSVYIQLASLDFILIMPTYIIFLGSLLVYLSDKCKSISIVAPILVEHFAYIPVITVLFDVMETYIQRRGCVLYPEKLKDSQLQLGSRANMFKWIFLAVTMLLIFAATIYAAVESKSAPPKEKKAVLLKKTE